MKTQIFDPNIQPKYCSRHIVLSSTNITLWFQLTGFCWVLLKTVKVFSNIDSCSQIAYFVDHLPSSTLSNYLPSFIFSIALVYLSAGLSILQLKQKTRFSIIFRIFQTPLNIERCKIAQNLSYKLTVNVKFEMDS